MVLRALGLLVIYIILETTEVSEACTIPLCNKYCHLGFYQTSYTTNTGRTCSCRCCPPLTCRNCFMRRKVVARDNRGCLTCRCGWPL